jgi:hypothetical protein
MNPLTKLPQPVQKLITDSTNHALKLYEDFKSKEKSVATLRNQIDSDAVPQSLQIKVTLNIPKNIESDPAYSETVTAAKEVFKANLENFQKTATHQMLIIAETAFTAHKNLMDNFNSEVEKKIIDFYYRLLHRMHPADSDSFLESMTTRYPDQFTAEDHTGAVEETLQAIHTWQQHFQTQHRKRLEKEVETAIAKEKKQKAKDDAEAVIMGDANNELVRDLIRKELQPLRKDLQRLNKSTVERGNSTGKQKNSQSPSRVSFKGKPRSAPADDKSDSGRSSVSRGRKGQKSPAKGKGRSQSPKQKDSNRGRARNRSKSPAPKSILKKSTNRKHHGKMRSRSSDSRGSRN